MNKIILAGFLCIVMTGLFGQDKPLTGRAAMLKANESKLIFPIFNGGFKTGVMPVTTPTLAFEHKGKCRLAFDMGYEAEKGKVNSGLEEIMRIINLHGAAGVRKQDLDVYIIFHGPATSSFLDNDKFMSQFQVNNPNLSLIKQLQDAGVKLVVCGQTIGLRNLDISALPDGTLKAYSAKTALSDLSQRGYMLYDVSKD